MSAEKYLGLGVDVLHPGRIVTFLASNMFLPVIPARTELGKAGKENRGIFRVHQLHAKKQRREAD